MSALEADRVGYRASVAFAGNVALNGRYCDCSDSDAVKKINNNIQFFSSLKFHII